MITATREAVTDATDGARQRLGEMDWLFAAALVVAVLLVYQPAWQGGFLWDDDTHVTRPDLRGVDGLCRIWFKLGTNVQYYPLLHTAFWIEYKLWGDTAFYYHLLNVLLHATVAVMAGLVLRRLKIPGAFLAAGIFALHPVCVESVAWITEQKNTLSGVFYMAAMLAYLRFHQTRKASTYACAFGLFVAALMSKTTAVTFPLALLVIFWWQRGKLSWRRDVLPLAPFFVLSAANGLLVIWIERTFVGARGAAFDLTMVERCLLAGRAIWFYAGKIAWPTHLIFVYPRWHVSQDVWWQYLFPAAVILVLAVLWRLRGRWRGPLAGVLFFIVSVLPLLGFVDAYLFVYTYVADHFQYLAMLGIITLAAAGMALLLDRRRLWGRPGGYALCLALLAGLGGLTWRQCGMYSDNETLYRAVVAENPECWMGHIWVGILAARRAHTDEAIAQFEEALRIKPDCAGAQSNLGLVLAGRGQLDEAIAHYWKALEFNPNMADAHANLGLLLAGRGQLDEAIAEFRKALEINPNNPDVRRNLDLIQSQREKNSSAPPAHTGVSEPY